VRSAQTAPALRRSRCGAEVSAHYKFPTTLRLVLKERQTCRQIWPAFCIMRRSVCLHAFQLARVSSAKIAHIFRCRFRRILNMLSRIIPRLCVGSWADRLLHLVRHRIDSRRRGAASVAAGILCPSSSLMTRDVTGHSGPHVAAKVHGSPCNRYRTRCPAPLDVMGYIA
jgi:hypothetical protein